MSSLTTVGEFLSINEADMACQRLQTEGYDASLVNEHWGPCVGAGPSGIPVLVQVPTDQAEDARDLLANLEGEAPMGEAEIVVAAPGDVDWVVVAHPDTIAEADIVCSRLRAEGIDAWLSDDICSFMGVDEPLSSKRRLLVNVPSDCLREAAALLGAIEEGDFGDGGPDEETDQ